MKNLLVLVAILLTGLISELHATEYTFQTISYPDATYTAFHGINDHGDIVGITATGPRQLIVGSFVLKNGTYQTVFVPGSAPYETDAFGINNAGTIVGSYTVDCFCVLQHGFVKIKNRKQIYTDIVLPFPEVTRTLPFAINNWGWIAGDYDAHPPFTGQCGFVIENGAYHSITVAGSTGTSVNGINDNGQIVGYWFSSDGLTRGFVGHFNDEFTDLVAPGAVSTFALAINNAGHVVGMSVDSLFNNTGWLYDGTNFHTITVPGGRQTTPLGINKNGVIVGYYEDLDEGIKAFIATPKPRK